MSQQANIVVYDGAATPVLHTLLPVDNKVTSNGDRVACWRENSPSLPDEAQCAVTIIQRKLKSGVRETITRVEVPVMESISGQNASGYTAAPKVAYTDTTEIIQKSHPRSTGASRQIGLQMARNILNNVSTSVPAVTAGVAKEALQDGFMPT